MIVSENLDITLGCGGSDMSAVALAVALDAAFCEINADVDGVFSAEPRVVPAARLVTEMDFEVALEMASLGSKVLHARCVELGAKYQMPIVVRNTFQPNDHQRTIIMSFNAQRKLEASVVFRCDIGSECGAPQFEPTSRSSRSDCAPCRENRAEQRERRYHRA
jgi:aspartate kinase